ncbi:7042_t:CDS:2 [Funneliformis mosseae]|uniref:7042_t:CDS:1 n=1 Tax=Funneliformis mosseae TaxID=27381 RepID=A0A9N8V2S3_FUNMO|nr:7042_t:CDS:2 [Funneliformis mosseae]
MVDFLDKDVTKISEVTDILILEQDDVFKLEYNLENCEDSLQLESYDIKESQYNEVIVKLDKNIIVK